MPTEPTWQPLTARFSSMNLWRRTSALHRLASTMDGRLSYFLFSFLNSIMQGSDFQTERDSETEMYLRVCRTHPLIRWLLFLGGVKSVLNCFKLVPGRLLWLPGNHCHSVALSCCVTHTEVTFILRHLGSRKYTSWLLWGTHGAYPEASLQRKFSLESFPATWQLL